MKINWTRNLGITLLGVWLLATQISALLRLRFIGSDLILAALAIVAGALIVFRK
ncbi:MAG: hypothetical protein KF886_06035 [Candidatus Hydrogenedentes bacterium]|nr:hypothetical protein [Candidatus Hydrogenedentota bacterium]